MFSRFTKGCHMDAGETLFVRTMNTVFESMYTLNNQPVKGSAAHYVMLFNVKTLKMHS